jgi:hypothetical protein
MTTLKPYETVIPLDIFVNMFKPVNHPHIDNHLLLLEYEEDMKVMKSYNKNKVWSVFMDPRRTYIITNFIANETPGFSTCRLIGYIITQKSKPKGRFLLVKLERRKGEKHAEKI